MVLPNARDWQGAEVTRDSAVGKSDHACLENVPKQGQWAAAQNPTRRITKRGSARITAMIGAHAMGA